MSLDYFMFIISAVVAVFGATMMIVQRNPVASVLYLILSPGPIIPRTPFNRSILLII